MNCPCRCVVIEGSETERSTNIVLVKKKQSTEAKGSMSLKSGKSVGMGLENLNKARGVSTAGSTSFGTKQ